MSAGGQNGGFESRLAFVLPLFGELDDKDGVLGGQANKHDKAIGLSVMFTTGSLSSRVRGARSKSRRERSFPGPAR